MLSRLGYGYKASKALRLVEGRAALAYFKCWQALPMRWKGIGRKPIREDWKHIGLRQSLMSGTNRHATHPVNAMLNYAYGIWHLWRTRGWLRILAGQTALT